MVSAGFPVAAAVLCALLAVIAVVTSPELAADVRRVRRVLRRRVRRLTAARRRQEPAPARKAGRHEASVPRRYPAAGQPPWRPAEMPAGRR